MATVNSERTLNYMKEHYGQELTKKEIAEALDIPFASVTGAINALIKKKYAITTRTEVVEDEPATETRKAKTHKVLYHTLTEAGLAYDPVAEEAEKKAANEAKKAARAAERAAKKAAKEAQKAAEESF
jgi:Mn-dependent DtxR family transcriptional regulator